MPEAYESIKRSYRRSHPGADETEVKSHASAIYIGKGKGKHRRAKALARHRKAKRRR